MCNILGSEIILIIFHGFDLKKKLYRLICPNRPCFLNATALHTAIINLKRSKRCWFRRYYIDS